MSVEWRQVVTRHTPLRYEMVDQSDVPPYDKAIRIRDSRYDVDRTDRDRLIVLYEVIG